MKNTYYIFFLFLLSCGPRTGIHHDEKEEENAPSKKPVLCGNALEDNNSIGSKLFKINCAVCHATHTDQKLTGPGLKGMADRLPKPAYQWFLKYTLNNEKVFKTGDAYAAKLKAEYGGAEMTIFEGQLEEADVMEIYKYITGAAPVIQTEQELP